MERVRENHNIGHKIERKKEDNLERGRIDLGENVTIFLSNKE